MDLHLILKHKWYDMIEAGIKKEDYRKIGDYYEHKIWQKRKEIENVVFHRGYTNTTMKKKVNEIVCKTGKTEWGAEEGVYYYVIRL